MKYQPKHLSVEKKHLGGGISVKRLTAAAQETAAAQGTEEE